jgi:hypothetical protein
MDTIARRSYVSFSPQISWYRRGNIKGLNQLSYYMSTSRPQLLSLIPTDDTTNPLVTHVNNPKLKTTISHNVNIGFQWNNDSTRRFWQQLRDGFEKELGSWPNMPKHGDDHKIAKFETEGGFITLTLENTYRPTLSVLYEVK